MTVGKKEFFSVAVLDLTLLYLQPEGGGVNSLSWGWVESLRMEAALRWNLQRGQWSSGDILRSPVDILGLAWPDTASYNHMSHLTELWIL